MTAPTLPRPADPRPDASGGPVPPRPRPLLAWLDLLVVPATTAAAGLVAALTWLRAVDVHLAPLVLVAAAVGPYLVAIPVARLARLGPIASYGSSLAGLVVVLAAGVTDDPARLASSLVHVPARLLSETLPLTGGRELLAVPVVVVWVGAALSAELTARSEGAGVLAVPVLTWLAAYAATAGAPSQVAASGALLLGALVLAALARRARADAARLAAPGAPADPGRPGEGGRLLVGVAAGALVAVGAGLLVPGVGLAGGRPAAPHRRPALATPQLVDPVDQIGDLRDGDPDAAPTVLASVTVGAASPGYAPVAVLDDYDGAIWGFARTFVPTGGRVPAPAPGAPGTGATVTGTTVTQSWHLDADWPLRFVPVLDRAREVTGLPLDVDAPTGMVLPAGTLALPASYGAVSSVPDRTLSALPAGARIDPGTGGGDLALPAGSSTPVATAVRFAAGLTGRRPAPTVSFLQAVIAALHTDERRIDPALPVPSTNATVGRGGTSLAEVVNAVTVSRKATPEQFATYLAVVARDVGVPARVATGFLLHPGPGGTSQVTDRDGWTWVEIPVLGDGWVVADPTPGAVASAAAPPTPATATTPTTLPQRRADAVPGVAPGGHRALAPRSQPRAPTSPASDPWPARLALVVLALAVLALAGPGQAGIRRWLRRRARRGPGPAGVAVGAWLELLDGLDAAGLRPAPDATGVEVAGAAGDRWGPDVAAAVAAVAATAEAAVYAPGSPPSAEQADAAWATARQVTSGLRRRLPLAARARALLVVGHQPRGTVRSSGATRRPVPAGGRRR